ncbi:MAG: pseudouridine synthase [Spiribacter sp.]|jgi:23S rRNA pseudouridine2605 synthase|nr:pseudouridine synthase [Spiribacter sp.]MDR9489602.1 pseudouridine synthase [Spiribacter sp.]
MTSEKLQKVLARAGLGSRREMERRIQAGEVEVDGRRAQLGDRVEANVRIKLAGRPVTAAALEPSPRRVIAYHKPLGELVTRSDPEGRKTVFTRLPQIKGARWIAIGRLDINTSGLLLLTTDGDLANRLMHPSHQLLRDYAVRIYGRLDPALIKTLTTGVDLEDGSAHFDSVLPIDTGRAANEWYRVRLREGRNRLVRRLLESQGLQVSRLMRVQYGPIALPTGMREGHFESLSMGQVRRLAEAVGLQSQRKPRSSQRS